MPCEGEFRNGAKRRSPAAEAEGKMYRRFARFFTVFAVSAALAGCSRSAPSSERCADGEDCEKSSESAVHFSLGLCGWTTALCAIPEFPLAWHRSATLEDGRQRRERDKVGVVMTFYGRLPSATLLSVLALG